MQNAIISVLFTSIILLFLPHYLPAQESSPSKPSITAVKLSDPNKFTLDGILSEKIWGKTPIATGFIQQSPDDGAPATERTEIQIAYTDKALYVAIKAYDSNIDSAAATLFRKDGSAYTDWVSINIDSYNDNRTSFDFGINPRGVRQDVLIYNNGNQDSSWDAVWEAETTINKDSWTAEVYIPFSQLRFDSNVTNQTWGINFQRWIARKEEMAYWSPTPQDVSGVVSQYGTLTGIENLPKINRLEVKPYVSSSLTRAPGNTDNPYYSQNEWDASFGGNINYGISSDFTLTGTINPDFGQVEADPAVINLSAFETFYPEQRPFFLEGTDIFEFGSTKTFNATGIPQSFYSRRIGRQPQGNIQNYRKNIDFVNTPAKTNIAGAAKVSGKTDKGFSLGILNVFTVREKAKFQTSSGQESSVSVEPPTNYFVGRLKQDYDNGSTTIGGYLSATNRMINNDYLKESLHSSAYVAGLDFEHGWNNRDWIVSGVFTGSSVQGSSEVISSTQKNSTHYYNRVDADYLSVDTNREQLNGYAGVLSFSKSGGEHWLGSLSYSTSSPGYEVNDLGFQQRADYHDLNHSLIYTNNNPQASFLRDFEVWLFGGQGWNYGGDHINSYLNLGGWFSFSNLWTASINFNFFGRNEDDRITRGGPVMKKPIGGNVNFSVNTNRTKKVSFNFGSLYRTDKSGEYDHNFSIGSALRPTTNIQLSLDAELTIQKDTDQYVKTIEDPLATKTYNQRYIFSDIDQTSLSTTIRLDWTFSPSMSLQTYARPLITTGNFYNYKEFVDPYGFEFDVYGEDRGSIQENDETYTVDPDGNGPANLFTFEEQDFNFTTVQTNAVFRWEYQPGSILYLVWQHDRRQTTLQNDFRFNRDTQRLLDTEPTNVFMVKFSYWFGS